MKITYYDSPTTNYIGDYNVCYTIHPFLLLSDIIQFGVDNSWARLILEDIDTWSPEKIVACFKECYKDHPVAMEMVKDYYEVSTLVKKNTQNKHNNPRKVIGINAFASLHKKFKEDLKTFARDIIVGNELAERMEFRTDGAFVMKPIDFRQKDNKEDALISEISTTITNRDYMLLFDKNVEEIFPFATFGVLETNGFDFIRIPLWDFPYLNSLDYNQMKYTRNDLQPAMAPFKIKLQEFWDEIVTIQFIDKNIEQLKHLCQSKLHPFVQPIQQAINESLYISQIRNKSENNNKLTMCLGITSVHKLIQYYEKVETVLPYVASEIKQQVSRYMDLKATQMFVYFKISNNEANESVSDTIL